MDKFVGDEGPSPERASQESDLAPTSKVNLLDLKLQAGRLATASGVAELVSREQVSESATKPLDAKSSTTSIVNGSELPRRPESLLGHARDVFAYNLVQAPLTGVSQLSDKILGTSFESKSQIFNAPAAAERGSAAWTVEVAAAVTAGAVPMLLFHRAVGPGAVTKMELMGNYGLKTALPSVGKAAAAGALWGGVLTPTYGEQSGGQSFWHERAANAASTALAFGALTAGTMGMKRSGNALLRNDLVSATTSGAAAGVLAADSRSLLLKGDFAGSDERAHAASTFALGGLMLGGATRAYEAIRPTSGIRGVRTAEDMKHLADTTIKAGHPERYAFEPDQRIPAKAEVLAAENKVHPEWHNRASVTVRNEIDASAMPVDAKKLVVSGFQELSYGLEALHTRPAQKPIVVVYGSARFKEGDFRYERARYIGGRAAQEGYDVMTGGGPGTMEAANRGAYEAGGNSIGVVLKLPHEKRGNGYQTMTLKHRNFFTRMEVLKQGDVFVVEDGGIGTAAEALDTLTHIQTGKLKEAPVYFVGKQNYRHLENWLAEMEKNGTISPQDRHLYRMVDNPDDIFADLARRRQAGH